MQANRLFSVLDVGLTPHSSRLLLAGGVVAMASNISKSIFFMRIFKNRIQYEIYLQEGKDKAAASLSTQTEGRLYDSYPLGT